MGLEESLLGKTITKVDVESDKTQINFVTDTGTVRWRAIGD